MQSVTALAAASQLAVEKQTLKLLSRCAHSASRTAPESCREETARSSPCARLRRGDCQSQLPNSLYPHGRLLPLNFRVALVNAQLLFVTVRPTSYSPKVEG